MKFLELIETINSDEKLLEFLKNNDLININSYCDCGGNWGLIKFNKKNSFPFALKCTRKCCRKRVSILSDSFFSYFNILIKKNLCFIFLF